MLRNITSENQQLREQNQFMRNLYCNNSSYPGNAPSLPPPFIQTPTSTRTYKRETSESPRKRLRMNSKSEESCNSASDSEKITSVTNVRFDLPEITESKGKSPRKYSPHINKLLASPKRITRSSVIQQNLAYSSPPYGSSSVLLSPRHHHSQSTPNSQLLESPSRRSLRLLEKDQHHQSFETPPNSTKFADTGRYTFPSYFYTSPCAKSQKLNFDMNYHQMMLTPESLKMSQPRSAKRSLDAIIHAIDQIEKS